MFVELLGTFQKDARRTITNVAAIGAPRTLTVTRLVTKNMFISVLDFQGYWISKGTGFARVRDFQGCRIFKGTGLSRVLEFQAYWIFKGTGLSRVQIVLSRVPH